MAERLGIWQPFPWRHLLSAYSEATPGLHIHVFVDGEHFEFVSLRYGLLSFKCLMTIHAMFDTQLEHVLDPDARDN